LYFQIAHDGPHEADELASCGDGSDHELAGSIEASPGADVADQDHGRERADAPEAGEPLNPGPIGVGEGDLFDLTIEVVPAIDLVVSEREILAKDCAVLGCETLLAQQE
jgi:hypothetical protein